MIMPIQHSNICHPKARAHAFPVPCYMIIRYVLGLNFICENDENDLIYKNKCYDDVDGANGDAIPYGRVGDDCMQGKIDDDIVHGDDSNDCMNGNKGDDDTLHADMNNSTVFSENDRCMSWTKKYGVWGVTN